MCRYFVMLWISFIQFGPFLLPYFFKRTNNDHETELFADNNKGLTS